jgi:inward rectifier potassium channel
MANQIQNTGFGNADAKKSGRYYGKDGEIYVVRKGSSWLDRTSIFHDLLTMRTIPFTILLISVYFLVNLLFAFIYYGIGVDGLGIESTSKYCWKSFWQCFFFSSQTLTTVGYGRLSPISLSANIVASIESLIGLLMFSLVTGLSYGRFAKPRLKIKFSKNALISPYDDIEGLMFRLLVPSKYTLSKVNANVSFVINVENDGIVKQEFTPLKLEIDEVANLILSWTIVHPIDRTSPMYGLSLEELQLRNAEILVTVSGLDEHSSNILQTRTSYTAYEIVTGQKFKKIYNYNERSQAIVLDINRIDETESV